MTYFVRPYAFVTPPPVGVASGGGDAAPRAVAELVYDLRDRVLAHGPEERERAADVVLVVLEGLAASMLADR